MPHFIHYISKCLTDMLHTAILLSDLMWLLGPTQAQHNPT